MYKRIHKATILAKFVSTFQYSIIKENTINVFSKERHFEKNEKKCITLNFLRERTFFNLMCQKQVKARMICYFHCVVGKKNRYSLSVAQFLESLLEKK